MDGLLHLQEQQQPWPLLPLLLALAFALRGAVALAGDFVLHPDEIMQYLEPAHRLVFGNGVIYWEYFYGARAWLVPGVVAGVLKLFDVIGLGQPWWYVGGVKLLFCALSLTIPAGMYWFARRHFGEAPARAALLASVFWYELVGFAHKPMTEFVATAPLLGLLALCVRPAVDRRRVVWQAAMLAVLAVAIRLQYALPALLLLGIVFLRIQRKLLLVLAATGLLLAVGMFDALTWDGRLFHSYVTNLRFNLILGPVRANESPSWQFLWWLVLASGGLSALCLLSALRWARRYALVLALITLVLLSHSLSSHKEYRFIFAVIPLWLLIGGDLLVRFAARVASRRPAPDRSRWVGGATAILFVAVSAGGLLNELPYQGRVYQAWSVGDRHGAVPSQPGSDLRGVPPSGPRKRCRRGVAVGPALSQHPRLLLPAPCHTVLRHHGTRHQSRLGDRLSRGHSSGGRGPRADGYRLLAGARLRRHSHPARPRRGGAWLA